MSTTFVLIAKENITDSDLLDEYDHLTSPYPENVEIARRSLSGITWKNGFEIIKDYLPPETPVYPIDNSPQGIYIIKDLINESEKI